MNLSYAKQRTLMFEDSYLNENWKYYTMDFHTHGFLELNYILEGSCSYIIGENTYPLKKQNLIIIDSTIPHKKLFDHTKPCSVLGCSFALSEHYPLGVSLGSILQTDPQLFKYFETIDNAHVIDNAQSIFSDMETLYTQFHQEKNDYFLFTLVNKILFSLGYLMKGSETLPSDYSLQIQNYIKNNYYHIQSIEEIARHVNLNKTYMERIFKKEMGISIWQYVMHFKMEAAKNLLLHPEIPIGEIDSLIGMNSRQAFYLQFKKNYHLSPLEYRKQATYGDMKGDILKANS
jgi:AraC family transcriptional regulator, melibiose operon regulatory protein